MIINLCYVPINILGRFAMGREIYWHSELTNWSNPWVTFGITLLSCCLVFLVAFLTAMATQKRFGYKERGSKWYLNAQREIENLHKKMYSEDE